MISLLHIDIIRSEAMPAITIRNVPEDIHRGLKALAASHGRSTEAEVRDILAAAVNPEGRVRMGQALDAIWATVGMDDREAAVIAGARDRTVAKPMSFDE
jgi:plasmid stability protein